MEPAAYFLMELELAASRVHQEHSPGVAQEAESGVAGRMPVQHGSAIGPRRVVAGMETQQNAGVWDCYGTRLS